MGGANKRAQSAAREEIQFARVRDSGQNVHQRANLG